MDDMFIVRGNNVFPAAVEAVLRRFSEIAEFRVTLRQEQSLPRVNVEIEPAPHAQQSAAELVDRVAGALQESLHFRAEVCAVAAGSLPRFEMKARRFVWSRQSTSDEPA
jgi:phenylacetate-CoA ligase